MRTASPCDQAETKPLPGSAPNPLASADAPFPKMIADQSDLKRISYSTDVDHADTDELYRDIGVGD